jgi:hypothetical protein
MNTPEQKQRIEKLIGALADSAEMRGASASDEDGVVRRLVESYGLDFLAWFCVCCELAERSARREGFKDQGERAAARMGARAAKEVTP